MSELSEYVEKNYLKPLNDVSIIADHMVKEACRARGITGADQAKFRQEVSGPIRRHALQGMCIVVELEKAEVIKAIAELEAESKNICGCYGYSKALKDLLKKMEGK